MKFEYKTFHLELDANQIRRADQTLEALQELGKDGCLTVLNIKKKTQQLLMI